MAASSSTVYISHKIGFLVSLVLTLVSLWLLLDNARKPSGRGYGPALMTLFAAPLILANPIYNITFDTHLLASSKAGNVALNLATWLGVIEMMTASMWNASLDHKLLQKFPSLQHWLGISAGTISPCSYTRVPELLRENLEDVTEDGLQDKEGIASKHQ